MADDRLDDAVVTCAKAIAYTELTRAVNKARARGPADATITGADFGMVARRVQAIADDLKPTDDEREAAQDYLAHRAGVRRIRTVGDGV